MSSTFFRPKQAAPEEELAIFFILRTEGGEDDQRLLAVAREVRGTLYEDLSRIVPLRLGSQFRLWGIEVRQGSVEIWVYVLGAFTLISQYSDFVRSVQLLISQIQDMLAELLGVRRFPGLSIESGWTRASTRHRSRLASFRISQELITLLLVSYLIVSHAALLVVFIRIALRALLPTK